jgi:hypothetical protein
VLDGSTVLWEDYGGKQRQDKVNVDTEVAFFYGLPDVGRNFVWKPINGDPSLALNYIEKVKSFLHPITILTR